MIRNENNLKTRELSQEEREILRRNYQNKIHAKEFLQSLNDYERSCVDKLVAIERDLAEAVVTDAGSIQRARLEKIEELFEHYALTLWEIEEFRVLSKALFGVNSLLKNNLELVVKQKEYVLSFLQSIYSDLQSWREEIFVKKEAVDIHYLDSSLFSSYLQLELHITGIKPEDHEDELELF